VTELLAVLLGFAGGVAAGMLGVGGGILFVPALALVLNESQLRAESTSLLAIVPVAAIGVWRQHGYGNVRLSDGFVVGLLSPVGVALGVVIANAVSQRLLELSFAGLLIVIAARLVWRALTDQAAQGR
jgi:uncharacterized membrane protein YfcA